MTFTTMGYYANINPCDDPYLTLTFAPIILGHLMYMEMDICPCSNIQLAIFVIFLFVILNNCDCYYEALRIAELFCFYKYSFVICKSQNKYIWINFKAH